MPKKETTKDKILKRLDEHSAQFNELMDFLREHMVTKADLNDRLESFATKKDLESFATKKDLNKMEHRLRDALDDKLANLRGDLAILMRKGDKKLSELVQLLKKKKTITESEANYLLSLEPFPQ